jgi:predicted DCC family thiol-disulfide oxidoreductase YuxK
MAFLSDVLCFSVLPVAPDSEYIFYDGHCGLCHRAVKFVLKHDRSGNTFRFAPLQGQTFQLRVPSKQIPDLPDSFVVLTREGKLLMRSDASLYVMRRLGGGWKVLADILGVIPRGLRDAAYDFVARVRYRVFGRQDDLCPIVPPNLRTRFDP